MSEFGAELIGTMILVGLGCGTVAGVLLKQTKSEGSGWIVITAGFTLSVAMGIYAAGLVSDAHINPAVTLGLAVSGNFPWGKVPFYLAGQIAGGIAGGLMVYFNYLAHWKKTKDKAVKLGVFAPGPAVRSYTSNFISEMIGTFILVFGIMFIGANELADGFNPLLIGMIVGVVGLGLGGATGFAINPARDLGPRIVHALLPIPGKGDSDWKFSWVPIVGPITGGIYGALFYNAMFEGTSILLFWITSVVILAILIIGAILETNREDIPEER